MIELDAGEYFGALADKVVRDELVFGVQFALTYRCNLACIHCYADGLGDAPAELSLKEIGNLFDEFCGLGCLSCTLTGGEPLVRSDFNEIYRLICERGIRCVLFTNATLIRPHHVELLRAYPPDWVEVSMYGGDAQTHDRITRRAGSYDAAIAGIRALEHAGVKVRLKAVVMNANVDEIPAIRRLAATVGDGSFRVDCQIMGRLNGDRDVCALRVDPARVPEVEMENNADMVELWQRELRRLEGSERLELYSCGAGKCAVYLSPSGELSPCLCATHISTPLREVCLRTGLKDVRRQLRNRAWPEDHPCRDCPERAFCQSCPAAALLDDGDELGRSAYRCEVAKQRRRYYTSTLEGNAVTKTCSETGTIPGTVSEHGGGV